MRTLAALVFAIAIPGLPVLAGAAALGQLGGGDGGFAADLPQAQVSEDGQQAVVEQYRQQNPDYEPFPADAEFLVRGEALHDGGGEPPVMAEGAARGGKSRAAAAEMGMQEGAVPYLDLVKKEAAEQGVDVSLILAVIRKESSFDPKAHNPSGATGLMQMLPSTAKWLGLKDTSQLTKPAVNIKYGVMYLKYLHGEFGDGGSLAELTPADIQGPGIQNMLAAYNAGPGNVRKYGGVPPFKETKNYVRLVTGYFEDFEGMSLDGGK